jgi:hypothetical protein
MQYYGFDSSNRMGCTQSALEVPNDMSDAPTNPEARHERDKPDNTAKTVEIIVNNREVTVPKDTTEEEILSRAGVGADFQLFEIKGDEEIPVPDGPTKVHHHQRFTAASTLDPS